MKKRSLWYRLLCLVLAMSVAWPQMSYAFAASTPGVEPTTGTEEQTGQTVDTTVNEPVITEADDNDSQPAGQGDIAAQPAWDAGAEDTVAAQQPEGAGTDLEGIPEATQTDADQGDILETNQTDAETSDDGEAEATNVVGNDSQPAPATQPEGDASLSGEDLSSDQGLSQEAGVDQPADDTDGQGQDAGNEVPSDEQSQAVPETTDGLQLQTMDAAQVELLATTFAEERGAYFYRLGYGVPFVRYWNSWTPLLTALGEKFTVEAKYAGGNTEENYGSRQYVNLVFNQSTLEETVASGAIISQKYVPLEVTGTGLFSYCVFPSEETIGRVPDKQFEGWYVYKPNAKKGLEVSDTDAITAAIEGWVYTQSDVDTKLTPEAYPAQLSEDDDDYNKYYDLFRGLGDTWDAERIYSGYTKAFSVSGNKVTTDPEGASNPVSIVGRWVDSDRSGVSTLKITEGGKSTDLTLYDDSIAGKTLGAITATKIEFSTDRKEYWLRVGADVETLDLTFDTEELYFGDYTAQVADRPDYWLDEEKTTPNYKLTDPANSHVQVTATFGGTATGDIAMSARMLPEWTAEINSGGTTVLTPGNSVNDPAHSQWTVTGIKLVQPSGQSDTIYNDITVTVRAPSGKQESTSTYVFHVQRLVEPTMKQFYGNTPVGMIERDSGGTWTVAGQTVREAKDAGINYFKEHLLFDSTLRPQGGVYNNSGTTYRGEYFAEAWANGANVDLDPTAIVVYQNSTFKDPGISLVDSEGKRIVTTNFNTSSADTSGKAVTETLLDANGDSIAVKDRGIRRILKLKTVTASSTLLDGLMELVNGSEDKANIVDCWYVNGALVTKDSTVVDGTADPSKNWDGKDFYDVVSTSGGQDTIDLSGLKILPGIYTMEYSFVDPVTGTTYCSDANSFETEAGKEGASAFSRTVVVLPIPGDVDMDGGVTLVDSTALKNVLDKLNQAVQREDPVAALFVYRVCDTSWLSQSSDSVVLDVSDVNTLETLPLPQVSVTGATGTYKNYSNYYYLPLLGGTTPSRTALPVAAEGETSVAKVSMVFLGKEKGTVSADSYTEGSISGPDWNGTTTDKVQLGDTFWVGVKLSNRDKAIFEKVDTFTLRLTYDENYLTPATVLASNEWVDGGDNWQRMMIYYNLNGSDSTTIWAGQGYEFTAATGTGQPFTQNTTQAKTPLEDASGAKLKTMTFSVRNSNNVFVNFKGDADAWLLAVPFTLKKHPAGQTTAQLVEFQAAMNGFTITGTGAEQTALQAAYSIQDSIFGGVTRNLKQTVVFGNRGATIPLDMDQTEPYIVVNSKTGQNPVYCETGFLATGGTKETGEKMDFNLGAYTGDPIPGLTYNSTSGLTGTPTQAGTYQFYVGGILYQLTVERADLHFWADSQVSYYGQDEFRGNANPGFTFQYRVADLCSEETKRATSLGIELNGKGASLGNILADDKYSQPTFTAMESTLAVNYKTPVGTYSIASSYQEFLTNYHFIYSPEMAGSTKGLTIQPRPVIVSYLNGSTTTPTIVGTVFSDTKETTLTGLQAQAGGDPTPGTVTFSVTLPDLDGNGLYGSLPLTKLDGTRSGDGVLVDGDSLIVKYSATYIQTDADMEKPPFVLALNETESYRDVSITEITLVGGNGVDNYRLVRSVPKESQAAHLGEVQGRVIRRNILALRISQLPPMTYSYGDQFSAVTELHYFILKDGDEKEGEFAYKESEVQTQGISVWWAKPTEEELAGVDGMSILPSLATSADTPDLEDGDPLKSILEKHPTLDTTRMKKFEKDQLLTLDYDGYYLCMWVESADENGDPKTIVRYSDRPLTIKKKTLTLTATAARRYYGEENGELTFTYDPRELAKVDLGGQAASALKGTAAELQTILADSSQAYVPPTLKAVETAMAPTDTRLVELTQYTPYSGSANALLIWGASAKNYDFQYVYTDPTGVTTIRTDYGASTYRIERRLIVLDQITKTEPLTTIYADTRRIYTDNLTLSLSDVKLGLPEHTATTTKYYSPGGAGGTSNIGYADGSDVTVVTKNGVQDQISFTYTATVASPDGSDYVKYSNFSKGYFNMGDKNEKLYAVQVSNLRLTGADANNYSLVYRQEYTGAKEMPNANAQLANCILPETNASTTYYIPLIGGVSGQQAKAKVILRPIQSIELSIDGRLSYQYGNTYSPMGSDASQTMRVKLLYANDPSINNYERNTTSETVDFSIFSYVGDKAVTSFDYRALEIYWIDGGETAANETQLNALIAANKAGLLTLETVMEVVKHNGKYLVVTGKRGSQESRAISSKSTGCLQVSPRTLTLKADDQNRVYGDPNPTFTFKFNAAQLAPRDQEKLSVKTGMVDSEKLRTLDSGYVAPVYTTAATPGSDVSNGSQGGYDIVKGTDGSLANYTLVYTSGKLYVYPRPIKIQSFLKDTNYPIYTIFSDVTESEYWTNATNYYKKDTTSTTTVSQFTMAVSSAGYTIPGTSTVLYAKTGDALYKNNGQEDAITLRVCVQYPSGITANTQVEVTVTNASLVAGSGKSSNYYLEVDGSGKAVIAATGNKAYGDVELRDITKIAIKHLPDHAMQYNYGESLDLTGLIVSITYNPRGSTGSNLTKDVAFLGTDQFAANGLYINYYNSSTLDENDSYASIRTDYRTAATGDHLTIAYTHDSQLDGTKFAANGKYLVVSAQLDQSHAAAEPQFLCEMDSQGRPISSKPLQLVVKPKAITFELTAADKTYDGNTQAAGTIRFTNMTSYQDSMNASITDLVYPISGSDYEEKWGASYKRAMNFASFQSYVSSNGYSFTTGTYVPSGQAPLGTNGTIAWSSGYSYGAADRLTFSFLDPNVAYQSGVEPGWDNYGALDTVGVQVTGLRLAGPDAANYTIAGIKYGETGTVTTETVTAAAAAGYGSTELPRATIYKRNRDLLPTSVLPQVQVDPHTNVVQIIYDQSLSAIPGGEVGSYADELHFEFALQKLTMGSKTVSELETDVDWTITDLIQWAGTDGQSDWADPRFFGGETAPQAAPLEDIAIDGGYSPLEEDIPKEDSVGENTTIKGQVYLWAEADSGFVLDETAYPGGVVWPGYLLYKTNREALERDTLYLPVVRAAETHNYNASPALSSVEGYTPQLIQTIQDAKQTISTAASAEELAAAQASLAEALTAVNGALSSPAKDAVSQANAERDELMSEEKASTGKDEEVRLARESAPVVKTYRQSIETVSISELKSATGEADTENGMYQIPILEAVWFTDVVSVASKDVLDKVVKNHDPVRYRIYAWDKDLKAELSFDKDAEPLDLTSAFEVEIPADDKSDTAAGSKQVNEGNDLRLFVDINFPSSNNRKVEKIILSHETIEAAVGDEPIQITWEFKPMNVGTQTLRWTSSDPAVATVSSDGLVTIVGPGTAVITVVVVTKGYNPNPVTATIEVTVTGDEEEWKKEYPESIFDMGNTDIFFLLSEEQDGAKLFFPDNEMTRGEVAELLTRFYIENPNWTRTGPTDFADLTGRESYADAARLLGSLGVMVGYPDGDFHGEAPITRAEFVALLVRMMGLTVEDTTGQEHAFLDTGEDGTWAYSEIDAIARQTTIVCGVGDGNFAPGRNITRAEAAAFLSRLLRFPMTSGDQILIPEDVETGHWAHDSILRAVNGSDAVASELLKNGAQS